MGRAKRAPPSILRAGEMRQTKVEAAPTAMRSPNFWAGSSQDPAGIGPSPFRIVVTGTPFINLSCRHHMYECKFLALLGAQFRLA